MKGDPFGNLIDWWQALELFKDLADSDALSECQPGIIRILRYKGNWRLREHVLRNIERVKNPSVDLIREVLSIIDDDTTYYDVRILACDALTRLLTTPNANSGHGANQQVEKVVRKLKSAPQPPFFENAITALHSRVSGISANDNLN